MPKIETFFTTRAVVRTELKMLLGLALPVIFDNGPLAPIRVLKNGPVVRLWTDMRGSAVV